MFGCGSLHELLSVSSPSLNAGEELDPASVCCYALFMPGEVSPFLSGDKGGEDGKQARQDTWGMVREERRGETVVVT